MANDEFGCECVFADLNWFEGVLGFGAWGFASDASTGIPGGVADIFYHWRLSVGVERTSIVPSTSQRGVNVKQAAYILLHVYIHVCRGLFMVRSK